jgi:hypothetical protein
VDKLPPSARAFLDAARGADDPSPAERARSDEALRAALARRGIEGLPLLAGVGASARHVRGGLARPGLLALKLGAGAVAVVVASYVGVRLVRPASEGPPPVPREARAPALDAAPPDTARTPARVREVRPAPAPALEDSRSHVHRAPANLPRRPELRRAARSTGIALDRSLEAELRTVASVDALVRQGRFGDALHLLERTETEAAAVLHEERTALRILARCGLEPSAQAQHAREQFLRATPRAVLADRVRNACAPAAQATEKP